MSVGLFVANASAACPSLPPDSGLAWQRVDGPDFIVCHAIEVGSKRELFGMYLGMHPNVHLDETRRVEDGSVAGSPVGWVERSGASSGSETVLDIRPNRGPSYRAHIWIDGSSREDRLRAKQLFERLRFGSFDDL